MSIVIFAALQIEITHVRTHLQPLRCCWWYHSNVFHLWEKINRIFPLVSGQKQSLSRTKMRGLYVCVCVCEGCVCVCVWGVCVAADCLCVSVLSRRGDGLHMQSVFTGLQEIMTVAENPPLSLRSHLSASVCVCVCVCPRSARVHGARVCYPCEHMCDPLVISVSALACRVDHAQRTVTSTEIRTYLTSH